MNDKQKFLCTCPVALAMNEELLLPRPFFECGPKTLGPIWRHFRWTQICWLSSHEILCIFKKVSVISANRMTEVLRESLHWSARSVNIASLDHDFLSPPFWQICCLSGEKKFEQKNNIWTEKETESLVTTHAKKQTSHWQLMAHRTRN